MSQSASNLTGFRSTVYIGLGSNMHDPIQQIQLAYQEIDDINSTSLIKVSSFYATAPVGYVEQQDFINAAIEVSTTLSPQELMQALLEIEARHERVREIKNGPRTLDLDILLFNEWRLDEPAIAIPHPRAHKRAFVLYPLHEIAPDLYIPGEGFVKDLLLGVSDQAIRQLQDGPAGK
jgi:2-amino-4-hydroxy-6-hydroxymethyldihydropteridine diphosphokinase